MKCILLVAMVCCAAIVADARSMKKRQAAVAGVQAAAEAAQAASALITTVSSTLVSGSGNMAMLRWTGDLTYTVDLAHGKTVMDDSNSHGGVVAVTKRDSALIGGEANVVLSAGGQVVGKVYLATYYSGSQPTAVLVIGSENFSTQTVTENGSTALILAYITPNDSYEVTSNQVSYNVQSASGSYNAASSTIQS